MIDLRLRTAVADTAIKELSGKVLGPADYDVLLTGPTYVRMPNNKPLCVYLPGALAGDCTDEVYEVLHGLRSYQSRNRGKASGTRRIYRGTGDQRASRGETRPIASAIIGAVDPIRPTVYCRLTAWTGRNLPEWERLHPMLRTVAMHLNTHVPDRYAAQRAAASTTDPAWIVPGTPFSTVTVNNTYPTGVHTDRGDLDAGFSTITCLRRGDYTGGQLVFPQYRVAADLHHGDLILMDAHQWHGNVPVVCACGHELNGPCPTCSAERISVVAYYRTKILECGTPAEEAAKAITNPSRGAGAD